MMRNPATGGCDAFADGNEIADWHASAGHSSKPSEVSTRTA